MGSLVDSDLHVAGARVTGRPRSSIRAPWSGEAIGEAALATAADAERAATHAAKVFAELRRSSTFFRKSWLARIAALLEARRSELTALIADEAGKPLFFAAAEVGRAIATFQLASELTSRPRGEVMALDATKSAEGLSGRFERVPKGPVLAISPFNFPLNLVAHKVAPALAVGASVVLKPAPQTPLTALALASIVAEAGGPEGAFQVLPSGVDVAEILVRDPRFAVLSFTGSDLVGWKLKAISGKKHVVLELGGNAATIVHDDAGDLDAVADKIALSAFGYAGQVCIKTQRLYVQAKAYDALVERIVARAGSYSPSDPRSEEARLGPMIDAKAAARVESWVDEAKKAGARELAGGDREGNRYPAVVLAIEGAGRGLQVVEEEAFGPVLTAHRYETFEEALALAGGSRYGLQAGLFTDSRTRVRAAFEALDVGGLVVGDTATVRVDAMPYGGSKDSGLGREGVAFAMDEFSTTKMLLERG